MFFAAGEVREAGAPGGEREDAEVDLDGGADVGGGFAFFGVGLVLPAALGVVEGEADAGFVVAGGEDLCDAGGGAEGLGDFVLRGLEAGVGEVFEGDEDVDVADGVFAAAE